MDINWIPQTLKHLVPPYVWMCAGEKTIILHKMKIPYQAGEAFSLALH